MALVVPFALGVLGILGCSATFSAGVPTVAGHEVTEARAVPVDIEGYPHVVYRGEYAYLVNGLWYYPTRTGWVIFEDEPRELLEARMRIESMPRGQRPPDVQYGYPANRPTPPREIYREYRR